MIKITRIFSWVRARRYGAYQDEMLGDTSSNDVHGNTLKIVAIILFLVFVSVLKSVSVFYYQTFNLDEEMVVRYAVGFMGGDLNPRWFGYHTLSQYIFAIAYEIIFLFYYLAGAVSTKVEFVSFLFDNNRIFFGAGRILCSFAYTLGSFTLAYTLYKKHSSKLGAIIFFIISSIIWDGLTASNSIRVDTFVYLFMTLTIYYGSYAPKNIFSYFLSIIFCSAAFCSKLPGVAFYPVLFAQILVDVRAGYYPKRYLVYFIPIAIVSSFIFMPYLFLDNHSYRQMLSVISQRASGTFIHVGKEMLSTFSDRVTALWLIVTRETGIASVAGTILMIIFSIRYKQKVLLVIAYLLSYLMVYSTSSVIDAYWLRPVYPLLIYFTILLISSLASFPFIIKLVSYLRAKNDGTMLTRNISYVSLILVGGYYLSILLPADWSYWKLITRKEVDARIMASQWIQENIPENSRIWIEGAIPHRFPKLLAADKEIARYIPLGFYIGGNNNQLLNNAFDVYYERAKQTQKIFNVGILGSRGEIENYSDRSKYLKPGDYIIISNQIYSRYYDKSVEKLLPELTSEAHRYYDYIRHQKHLQTFTGSGILLDIFLVNSEMQ